MTVLASSIIDKARIILNDPNGTRWGEAELLDWLNDGQKEAVRVKPDINPVTTVIRLVTGTRQTLSGIVFIDVIRNMGEDTTTPGKAARKIIKGTLDEMLPGWHSSPESSEVTFACAEINNPRVFYVYPPQPSSNQGSLEVVQSEIPIKIPTIDDPITINDVYETALIDYVLSRAFGKDAEYAAEGDKAMTYYQKFISAIASQDRAEKS